MNKLLLSFIFTLISGLSFSQTIQQYFDGADTLASNSIIIRPDTASDNIWQIGKPHKAIFDSAATYPNVLVTDTVNNIPDTNISRFSFSPHFPFWSSYGILAIRWKQKLDFKKKHQGGIIEYSSDTGKTWHNVFNSPYVYNFYGYDTLNKDTLITGDYAFSGTDSSWRDIWLCFDKSYLSVYDSVIFRFTSFSDTAGLGSEGWMIDNMSVHLTWHHTVVKMPGDDEYMHVYPTRTTGIVHIEAKKLQEYHIIKSMQLTNMEGKVVRSYGISPTKFYIDISNLPDGMYYLKVNTNIRSQSFPVILSR